MGTSKGMRQHALDLHYTTSTGPCDVKKFVMDAMGEITLGPHREAGRRREWKQSEARKTNGLLRLTAVEHNYR